ncbi:hypothetical protein FSP39_019159 [Pinctada imbricata]|uniref:RNB domain-containing protein n=1 Tax=Pinctada imbricata TaxID=66713 RepID=A0AA89BRF9_PINIB|nr:hypothetical protein FSP39_019159 [Pinctada imbricata]
MEVVQPEPEPAKKKEEAKDGRRAANLKTSRTSAEESNGLHREKGVPSSSAECREDDYDIQNFEKDDDMDDTPFLLDEDDAQTDLHSAEDLVSIHDQVSRLMIKGISLKSQCVRSLAQGNYKYDDYNEDEVTDAEDDLLERQPKKFKRCIIQIESAHKAICTNMDSADEIKEIEISGRSKCGKSFSEDEVLVEILKEEGKNQIYNFIPMLSKRPNQQTKQCKVYGAVKRTLKRNRFVDVSHPVLVCAVDEFECHLMKPLCRTIPKLYVQKRGAKEGFTVDIYEYTQSRKTVTFKENISVPYADRHSFVFLVAYIKWDRYYPRGVVLRCIRTSGSLMNGISLLKLIHRVPGQCEESVLKVATSTASNETLNADENRTDLSGLETFTIDPKDSTDLDDALSIEKLPNGLYQVGVHIADVSSDIQKDSTIDKAAQERLVTFYTGLGFEANHMLPSILSQNLLSLKQDRLRKTISVFFLLDKDGLHKPKPMIQKTLIRSRRQFSYTEVQDIIDGKSDYFSNSIHDLYDLAISIRKIRLREEMYSPQSDEDNMDDLDNHELAKDAQLLVEEFMILANQFVGKFLVALFPDCVPLRCQDPPSQYELEEWKLRNDQIYDAVLRIQRILENGKSISKLDLKLMRYNKILPFQKWIWNKLHEAVESEDYNLASLLLGSDEFHPEQALALVEWFKIQEKGYYKCSGSIDGANEEYFSMHIMHYTHFTSPIRRYIDVTVHRLVHAAIEGNDCPYTQTEVQSLCKNVNEISRRANMYQRECMTLLWAYDIQKKPALLHVFANDLTDANIGFHVPLKNVSSHSKKIPLSQLSPLKRPELKKDRETARDQVAVVWQKRIYSFTGYGPITRHKKKDVKRIDPDQRAVFQQKKKWFQILQMLVHDHVTDLTKDFFDMNYHMSSSSRAQFNTEMDVSSEVRDGELIQQTCDFEMIFHHAQIISVQFMTAPIKGVLTPVPQLLDLTRNVKFCLEHMRDPVQVFERYATEKIRSKYASCAQYLSVVLPLLMMESAITAIQRATASINEVPVSFDNIGGQFTLLMSFCDRRDIDFNSMAMDFLVTGNEEDDEEIEYVPSSDYLCIRCDIQDGEMPGQRVDEACTPYKRMVWIGHGKIDKIKRMKKRGKVAVHFQLRKNSMMPTPKMQNNNKPVRCCVELLQKAEVERRSDAILQYLPKGSQLAMAIALGRKPSQMSKQHLDFVKSVGTEPEMFMTKQSKYPRNNPKQAEAIRNALEQSFSLIQGPPGTGKTYTGVKLIHLFCTMNRLAREAGLTQRQLVFCGPSNKSVDLVAKWILKDKAPCMVRVYGSSMENMDFPIPGKVFPKKARSRDGKPDRKLQEVSLHHLIRADHNQHAKEIRRYDKLFRENPAFSDIDEIKKYKSLLSKAVQEELTLYDVIFCTTAMATNHKFLKGTKGKIYQLIIDEAGMCTEPECVAPIIATQAKQVVLIGDHKQLRPTIMCQYATDLGLARSLFERYANKAILLNMQYRMHPKICEFPSQTFYKGKLMTDMKYTSAWYEMDPLRVWPVFGTPHLFCHVVGAEEHLTVATEEGNELSRSNKAEVEVVVKIVAHLLDIERVNQEKINIMSQYNAQCYSLKDSLREKGLINLNINTVVASQGGEWDYVIFSTVRSLPQYRIEPKPSLGWCKQNLGFITDAHQINVALTRARKGLIIVGNKNLLRCESTVWRPLLQHYGKQGCVMDAGEILKSF